MGVYPIAEAKKQFPSLIREATQNLRPILVANAQRKDSERAVILGEEAVLALLQDLPATPDWEWDEEHGLWSVVIDEFDVWGQGATREEARADLIFGARDYAGAYMDEPAWYFRAGRAAHYAYALAITLAGDDDERVARLLGV